MKPTAPRMPCRFFLLLAVFLSTARADETPTSPEAVVGDLYAQKQLLNPKKYPKLRRAFTEMFEKDHDETIHSAWADDEFRQWLDKNSTIKEEFYLAVEPDKDDLPEALRLFKEIWQKSPKKIEEYPALAIAVAVVWDKKTGIFGDCKEQFGATEPEPPVDALGNFAYYSSLEKYFGNRIKLLPYEFLCFVVCHNTTLAERKWAMENYYNKRVKLGDAYHDVKWLTNSEIKGKPYTLDNQLRYGGVCTCRADFAVQLCRSLAVPAMPAGAGWPKYSGGHSWINWVKIKNLSSNRVDFTIENCGRYNSDSHIYHTGGSDNAQYKIDGVHEGIIGDQLSRVGQDVMAYRQAKVVMKLYPLLLEREKPTLLKQLELLGQIDDFSPRCEEAWTAMAAAVRDRELDKKEQDAILKHLTKLVNVFAKRPDFPNRVLPDLLSSPSMVPHRDKIYQRYLAMLETSKRTDLIFAARRLNGRRLVEENRAGEAITQLGQSTILHAIEASRIEPMLNDIEAYTGSGEKLRNVTAKFYQQFLNKIVELQPKIPKEYARDMYNRGAKHFELVGDQARARAARHLAAKVVGEDSKEEKPPGTRH